MDRPVEVRYVLAVRLHGDDRHDEERQDDDERGVGHTVRYIPLSFRVVDL